MASKREIDKANMFRKIMPSAAAAQDVAQAEATQVARQEDPAADDQPHTGGTLGEDAIAALFAQQAAAQPEAAPEPASELKPEPVFEALPEPEPVYEPEPATAAMAAPEPSPVPEPGQPSASGLVLEPANEWAAAVEPHTAPPLPDAASSGPEPGPVFSETATMPPLPEPDPEPEPPESHAAAPAPATAAETSQLQEAYQGEEPFPVNLAEILVEHYYPIYRQRLNACPCPRCQDDACGMALNRIEPHYVVSTELNPEDLQRRPLVTETVTALVNAIFKVKRSPRHDAQDPVRH